VEEVNLYQQTRKMKNIELSIPGMQSTHCQSRVRGAIAGIAGIDIQRLESGRLIAAVKSDKVKEKLVETIEKAGYEVNKNSNEK